jgi:hypothetical protein
VIDRPWRTFLVQILISRCSGVVSDHCLTSSGSARLRKNLARTDFPKALALRPPPRRDLRDYNPGTIEHCDTELAGVTRPTPFSRHRSFTDAWKDIRR